MEYIITFLEGVISFISPCMLPMLPIYISYFAGASGEEEHSGGAALPGAFSFVAGFTLVFCSLGVFAGTVGRLLMEHQKVVNAVCGIVVILMGLVFLDVIPLPFLKGVQKQRQINSIFSAFVFGMVFSVSLTPCVGAFLGAALMMASSAGGAGKGALLLLIYSLGLGIPFLISAVLIDRLKNTFQFIKSHYKVINLVCGGFLILVGVMMAAGWMNRLLAVLSVFS